MKHIGNLILRLSDMTAKRHEEISYHLFKLAIWLKADI